MQGVFNSLLLLLALCGVKGWTYPEQENWSQTYPSCAGKKQSPIKISSLQLKNKNFPPLVFTNYQTNYNSTITNNGHTAEIQVPEDGTKPQVTGGPLDNDSVYQFLNVHFHWGDNDAIGSEHVVDGHRFSAEVHAVHYNTKYSGLEEALQNPDGIAVVTTFYQANPTQSLAGLQPVSDALPSIVEYETSTQIENFQLSGLYNDINSADKQIYYTYPGSLTTPPCSEAVTWIIFTMPIIVSSDQLKPFRTLKAEDGSPLVNNYRNLQDKNGRVVTISKPKSKFPLLGRK